MIQAKTLSGVVKSFDEMQKAIGKEMGVKTTTLIRRLATDDAGTLNITFCILNVADQKARRSASADRSGEADETSTKIEGSAEGESAVPQGDAHA